VDAGVPLLGTPVESIHAAEDEPGLVADESGFDEPQ